MIVRLFRCSPIRGVQHGASSPLTSSRGRRPILSPHGGRRNNMEPITITLGVITVIAALAAIGLVLWGALRGVMWMVVIGAILALLTPWAGPLWFGWSWWTSLFLT